jgi:hypothetical protein
MIIFLLTFTNRDSQVPGGPSSIGPPGASAAYLAVVGKALEPNSPIVKVAVRLHTRMVCIRPNWAQCVVSSHGPNVANGALNR